MTSNSTHSHDPSVPFFSVLIPIYKPDIEHLRACIDSVLAQTTADWELCLVTDGPQTDEVNDALVSEDERVHVYHRPENGGIAAATDDALQMAKGEFIVLLDNDDTLAPHALGTVAWEINRFANVDMVFSDEDHLDPEAGERVRSFFKPGYSPERLRQQMYVCHLGVYRRSLVLEVGGFRPGFDGSQDHDLALRVSEKARRVLHIPQILYHWRESPTSTAMDPSAKDWAYEAGVRAVQSHLERTNFPAVASRNPQWPGMIDLEPNLQSNPLVSIIMPTGGARRLINGVDTLLAELAIESLFARSTYKNFELIIVLDSKSPDALGERLQECASFGRVKVVRDTRKFNFAQACNLGAASSDGDMLVFLNDDTEILTPNWIERLLMYGEREDIGAVGVKLLYSDGRINHAGVWARHGHPGHRYVKCSKDNPGYYASLVVAQNCLMVTAACLAVQRSKFDYVGGFSTIFPLSYNDVDLCLKLSRAGFRSVIDGANVIRHHESSTRDPTVRDWEFRLIHQRWKVILNNDPYDNPNHLTEGVEEYPPPHTRLTILAEEKGEASFAARAWPAVDDHLICS